MSQNTLKKVMLMVITGLLLTSMLALVLESKSRIEISQLRNAGVAVELNTKKGAFDEKTCSNTVKSALKPFNKYLGSLKKVVIHGDKTLRRGLSNGEVIYLRCLSDQTELKNVLIHEIAHVIDLGYFVSNKTAYPSKFDDFGNKVYLDDLSAVYYTISWDNNSALRANVSAKDFVSEYAMTDPFEDFAEALIVYKEYGPYFRNLIATRKSSVLQQKYDFIKGNVFEGKEFGQDNYVALANTGVNLKLVYDATKLYQVK